jgi:transaldolase
MSSLWEVGIMITIFADTGDVNVMRDVMKNPLVEGITTNPSLLKKSGIKNYREFAKIALSVVRGVKPISFEVLSDDWEEMFDQANEIASWADNCYIKIPITNTKGESSIDLIDSLSDLRLNITAVMTEEQLDELRTVDRPHHIISVFAGRIKDAGKLPPIVHTHLKPKFKAKLLWASTRETHDMDHALMFGYDIITMTPDLLAKLPLRGKDLKEYSLETVKQFYEDGRGIEF